MHAGPQRIRVGICAERILAHLRHLGLVFLLRNERAELRAAQVRGHRSVIDAQPDLPPHISGRLKAQGPNEPQMDVNHVARVIRIEVEEEVLAKGFGEGEGEASTSAASAANLPWGLLTASGAPRKSALSVRARR